MKIMPCSTSTVASGRSMRRWISPPQAPMPPSRMATGMMASGLMAGQEGDEDAGVAIAGRQRGIGAALHGGDLDHAGQSGKAAGQRGEASTT